MVYTYPVRSMLWLLTSLDLQFYINLQALGLRIVLYFGSWGKKVKWWTSFPRLKIWSYSWQNEKKYTNIWRGWSSDMACLQVVVNWFVLVLTTFAFDVYLPVGGHQTRIFIIKMSAFTVLLHVVPEVFISYRLTWIY